MGTFSGPNRDAEKMKRLFAVEREIDLCKLRQDHRAGADAHGEQQQQLSQPTATFRSKPLRGHRH